MPITASEDDDLPYEEEIIRNPYSVKCWMRYIEFKQNGSKTTLNMIYERALKELPGRYWYCLCYSKCLKNQSAVQFL
uniref:Pre-mRNA-splicing factor Syf1-like N-terminal HAT-repeats domain-containing protein n=1 Tax=Periophthalmus magnuspinnatus TaxID=409849 RepID=A0A3B3ZZI7_9GOBI